MPYRNIFVANETVLRLKNRQLTADNGEKFTFPVEDIRCIVIDNERSVLSARLISFLAENGVCLIVCDRRRMPSAQLVPTGAYCRVQKRILLQTAQSKPRLKRIWQKIVVQKIENQARCIDLAGKTGAERLFRLAGEVQSGDPTNREGCAARIYFPLLFGGVFTRDSDIEINAALNYGYAVIRAFIAKTLAAYGLEPSIGIHHKNQLNAFNLADDLIEPFRPIVDLFAATELLNIDKGFNTAHKAQLVRLLNCAVTVDGERCSLARAVDSLVQSLIYSFENEEIKLRLPEIGEISFFEYE